MLINGWHPYYSQNYLTGGEDRCKPLKMLTTKTCSCAPTRRIVANQACAVCKMAKLAGDENRTIECVRLLEPIPLDVLCQLRSHYFKYMRVAEQPAARGPLGANMRAIPVKGFSHEAVQTIFRYLNLPIWCPVPNGDLVRCSCIDFFCDFTTRFGCVPYSHLSPEICPVSRTEVGKMWYFYSLRERL